MTLKLLSIRSLLALVLAFGLTRFAGAELLETFESRPIGPFGGVGDLMWTGDPGAWGITTATWPTAPAQDFAGVRSLRSSSHRSTPGTQEVETVITDISSELDFSKPMEWSVFFSGNSISIQPNRRADFILLSDRAGPIPPEQPDGALNGYKLTLNDPYANATDNIPPSSHEGAALADSLTLWRIAAPDDRWRVVGSIPLGVTDDIRDGWNLRARRDVDGTWSIGFVNGPIGQVPALTSLGIDAGAPALSAFDFISYAGVGWTAPNNTTNDHTDFGFDNFRVVAIPEPTTAFIAALSLLVAVSSRPRQGHCNLAAT
jgi:hypothetical protein